MSWQVYVGDEVAISGGRRKLSDVVAEYNMRKKELANELDEFTAAQERLKASVCVGGTYFYDMLNSGMVSLRELENLLLKSAWRHVYEHPDYHIEYLASAEDKGRISRMLESPPEFTLPELFEWFGDLAADPRASILRGLAEVFSGLDQAFKSHERMKVGVKGLPKRVILRNVGRYGWGRDRLTDVVNAVAAVEGKPLIGHKETVDLLEDGDCMRVDRGMWLKQFANGNGHLFFAPDTLKSINVGLSEYYGEVLPDCPETRPCKESKSTDVAKDLQYFPTPKEVVSRLLGNTYRLKGKKVLEPSCGCGRIMDAARSEGAEVFGIEYDPGRVAEAKAKGHSVMLANFLDVVPSEDYDFVIMNPPFYGRHYAKHVKHALDFLKPGGMLYAILPITARVDHGELDEYRPQWSDLPVGSFKESGTNINTTIAKIHKSKY